MAPAPSASGSSAARAVTMERFKVLKAPMSEMLTQLQRAKPARVSTTDVQILCVDGFIPAHSVVLRLASPFFADLFSAYSNEPIRSRVIPVLLPDFDVRVVRKVIQMMYCGFAVNISSEKEVDTVKELLQIFEMAADPSITLDQTEVFEGYLPLMFSERLLVENNPLNEEEDSDYEDETFEIEREEVVYEEEDAITEPHQSFAKSESDRDEESEKSDTDVEELPIPPASTPVKEAEVVELTDESGEEQETDKETEATEEAIENFEKSESEEVKKSPMAMAGKGKSGPGSKAKSSPPTPVKRSLRPRAEVKSSPATAASAASDSSESEKYKKSSSSSDEYQSEDDTPLRQRKYRSRRTAAVAAKTRLSANKATKVVLRPARSTSTTSTTGSGGSHSKVNKPTTSASVKSDGKETEVASDVEYISSINENDDDDDSDYANKKHEKFMEASRRCNQCGKFYKNAKEASICVTDKHKMVRCYYCFKVLPNTEALFEHYKVSHKKAGKEGHLLCKFCHQAVSFKSVSTHVISNHLFDKNSKAGPGTQNTVNASFNRGRPGRPPTIANTSAVSPGVGTSPGAGAKRAADVSSEDDSDSDDDEAILAGKTVSKKTTPAGKKIKMHR